MPQNAFFLRTRDLLVSPKKRRKDTFFSTLHPLSTVIFAAATVLAFVLLRDSRLIFHCYTQCEATPTQKSARKCAATSRDFLRERLQSAFTLAKPASLNRPIARATNYCLLPDTFWLRASKNAFTVGSVKFPDLLSPLSTVKKVRTGSKSSQGT